MQDNFLTDSSNKNRTTFLQIQQTEAGQLSYRFNKQRQDNFLTDSTNRGRTISYRFNIQKQDNFLTDSTNRGRTTLTTGALSARQQRNTFQ
ncbi:hypothetical protein PoB_007639900 [Plakobranchus ocellatus]|uniref:Uncharacterized protein n=1 Tax=Plakobranchus ocellatus TaxID=259542 RepID=A0AAV4E0R6_9GAST|nr:hypothetical protein PoB_007639900 [Plakobranchus ocellatus]